MKRLSKMFGVAAMSLVATQAMAEMSAADKTFASNAAAGGLAEVSMGKLAEQHGASPLVKQFGKTMISDHTQANTQLKAIARQQNLTVPTNLDAADRATEQRLRAMKGKSFDQAYMRDMVQDHQKDVSDFQQEATSGQDPALKAFAQQTLPVLQQHLKMAESITGQK